MCLIILSIHGGMCCCYPLVFATSHLESLDNAKARKAQLEESLRAFGGAHDVVFCGDTNIDEATDRLKETI